MLFKKKILHHPKYQQLRLKFQDGFTLSELLIALAILGIIASFTIPKLLGLDATQQANVVTKDSASIISAALQQFRLDHKMVNSSKIGDLTPYLNYVSIDTTSIIDDKQTLGSDNCADTVNRTCLKLHNGSMFVYCPTATFGGTGVLNADWFHIDPDRTYSNTTDGPGKAVEFWIYTTGRLATRGTISTGTAYGGGTVPAAPAYDPPWFHW